MGVHNTAFAAPWGELHKNENASPIAGSMDSRAAHNARLCSSRYEHVAMIQSSRVRVSLEKFTPAFTRRLPSRSNGSM